MKKKKSIIFKISLMVFIILAAVFCILDLIVAGILKDEVLEQWKESDGRLVDVYAQLLQERECSTAEEYKEFVDEIGKENTYSYVVFMQAVNGKVTAVAHSDPDRVGITLDDEGSIAAARDGESYVGYYTYTVTGKLTLDVLTPVYDNKGNLQGALNIGIPVDSQSLNSILASSLIKLTLYCIGFSLLLVIILSGEIYRIVVKPLKHVSAEVEKIADYDLTAAGDEKLQKFQKRTDEIGVISNGFVKMRSSLVKIIGQISGVANELTSQSDELSSSCGEVLKMGTQLLQAVDDVAEGATSQAQQTAEGNQEVAQLSSLILDVEENMTELNQAVREVDDIKNEGMKVLEALVQKTRLNNENSRRVHNAILETSGQADRIKEASSQIQNIASQTSLLALNASIESARAGEAGKGFAVVASEIGNLSQQTDELTGEIENIIKDLIEKMEDAVKTITEMEEAAESQTDSVRQTRKHFTGIADKMKEMEEKCSILNRSADGMKEKRQHIVDVISDLSALSEENAACMEEAAASVTSQTESIQTVSKSSEDVAGLAAEMMREVELFKLD